MTATKRWPLGAFSRAVSRAFSSSTAAAAAEPAGAPFPLKNVTRSNFDSALAELRSHVRAADFVAIDLEMTGITSAPWRESFEFDSFDVRYLKVKDSAEKFAVLQFGVCPFRWDTLKESFIAHPHNFFIFPRQEVPLDGPSYEFLCQTSSMDFLAKYQFDFNACINEGISYLSRKQEEEALRRLNTLYEDELMDSWHDSRGNSDTQLLRMADILFTERIKNILIEWRDGLLRNRNKGSQYQEHTNDSKQQFQTIFFKMRPALGLTGFTSHQLRLIQMVSKKHFKDLVYVRVNNESSSQELIVYTDLESDKELLMKEVKEEHRRGAELKIKAAVGFRHVIDLLSSENKLIVGHNCFLDIAHIYSKFLGPLPVTAEEFLSSVTKYFPLIIDTKVLLNKNPKLKRQMRKSRTTLSSAFASLCVDGAQSSKSSILPHQPRAEVEVQVDEMSSSNWNSGAKHEAGYDAFMTGSVFAQALSHLGIDFKLHSPSENLAKNEKLQEYINLLYLSWIHGDIIGLRSGNMTAESFKKSCADATFNKIILIWGFPSKLKGKEIRECICKVFGPTSVTSIYHVDDTAVFVQFRRDEFVSDFLELKGTLEKNDDPISVLHPLSKLLEGGTTRAASYEAYKEICSSPISKVLFADQADAVGSKWKTDLVTPKNKVEVEVETGEQRRVHQENAVKTESDAAGKTKETVFEVNDPLHRELTSDEIIDSLFAAKANQI